MLFTFVVEGYGDHRDLHVLTHSFPTRRSADLGHASATALARHGAVTTLVSGPGHLPDPSGLKTVHVETAQEMLAARSEEHTSELQSLMRISYAVFCLKKKNIS